jgi:outer membrane immunogenic protein
MKKFATFVVFLAALPMSAAAAADFSSLQFQAPPPIHNWEGFYVGGFVGGASGAEAHTTEPLRLDNFNFWFRPFSNPYGYGLDASPLGGLTVGYNLQIPQTPLVLGIEGEYGYLGEYGSGRDVNQLYYSALIGDVLSEGSPHCTSVGSHYGYGLVGGRIGYAFDSLLIYVKAAALFTTIDTNYFAVKKEDVISPLPHISTSSAVNALAFAVGGGVEYALPVKGWENISLKVEYLYFAIANTQSSFGYCSCNFLWTNSDTIGGVHTAKFGVNYKFSGLHL